MLKQFVCVRRTQMNDVNLALFNYDYDVTFMAYFLSPQEGVYSRFGGRDADSADGRLSVAGLKHTMKLVLAAHQKTPEIAAPAPPPKLPHQLFQVKGNGCMHCHHVWEGLRKQAKKDGTLTPQLLQPYPMPENVGLKMERDAGNIVAEVLPNSPAYKIGLRDGDRLTIVNQVPIFAQGDIFWALHKAPSQGTASISWQRGDQPMASELELTAGWRKTDTTWRHSMRKNK